MNTTTTEQPILSARPIDWTQGIERRFFQLSAVLAKAKAAGWHSCRKRDKQIVFTMV